MCIVKGSKQSHQILGRFGGGDQFNALSADDMIAVFDQLKAQLGCLFRMVLKETKECKFVCTINALLRDLGQHLAGFG